MVDINFDALKEYTSTQKEYDIWFNFFHDKSIENRNKIAEYYIDDLKSYAKQYKSKTEHKIPVEEFISVLSEALLSCICRYKPENAKFTTFIRQRMHGAAKDYLRAIDPLARSERQFTRNRNNAIHQLEHDKNDDALIDEEEIALTMGIDIEHYNSLRFRTLSKVNPHVIDITTENELSNSLNDDSKLKDTSFEGVDSEDLVEFIINSLDSHPDHKIYKSYILMYFIEGKTYTDIAKLCGCSAQQIKRRIHAALKIVHDNIKYPPKTKLAQDQLILG